MPGASRALHRRRPAGLHPVARKKEIRPGREGRGPRGIYSRSDAKGRIHFLDERDFLQLRFLYTREKLRQFRERLLDRSFTRQGRKGARGADYQFYVITAASLQLRLVVHPMNLAVQQHRVFEAGNLAVEPQMHAANRPMLMALNLPG